MSDAYHQEVEKWARQQRDHFHDRVEDRNHPTARIIYQQLQQLEDAAQSGHNLRSLHDRMEHIERQVLQSQHSNERILTPDHSVEMYHNIQNMRNSLRPHF